MRHVTASCRAHGFALPPEQRPESERQSAAKPEFEPETGDELGHVELGHEAVSPRGSAPSYLWGGAPGTEFEGAVSLVYLERAIFLVSLLTSSIVRTCAG